MINFRFLPSVTTRERGAIPGCLPPGRDDHMARDHLGRPWIEVAASIVSSRKGRNACIKCGEMVCEHRK
jgi:hypothetical protein